MSLQDTFAVPACAAQRKRLSETFGESGSWTVPATKEQFHANEAILYRVPSCSPGTRLAVLDARSWRHYLDWILEKRKLSHRIYFENKKHVSNEEGQKLILCEKPLLKREVEIGVDVVLLPIELWKVISSWYPVDVEIIRQVFGRGTLREPILELYPSIAVRLQLCRHQFSCRNANSSRLGDHQDRMIGNVASVFANGCDVVSQFKQQLMLCIPSNMNQVLDWEVTECKLREVVNNMSIAMAEEKQLLDNSLKLNQLLLLCCQDSSNVSLTPPAVGEQARKRVRTAVPTGIGDVSAANQNVESGADFASFAREEDVQRGADQSTEMEIDENDDTRRRLRAISVSDDPRSAAGIKVGPIATVHGAGSRSGVGENKSSPPPSLPRVFQRKSGASLPAASTGPLPRSLPVRCTPKSLKPSASEREDYTVRTRAPRGECGLRNLGNTCYMNSALQCLSNTEPLREYFLGKQHLAEINHENPLGSAGRVAVAFADLLSNIWSGENHVVSPRKMRNATKASAKMFEGFEQHDAQELLASVLDLLHEDLNRVHEKPYIEKKESMGLGDEGIVANASWQDHLKRNSSIVVDLFHGQLRSQVTCDNMDCGKLSISFDPFSYLSVPVDRSVLAQELDADPSSGSHAYQAALPVKSLVFPIRTVMDARKIHQRVTYPFTRQTGVRKLEIETLEHSDKVLIARVDVEANTRMSTLRQAFVEAGLVPDSGDQWNWTFVHISNAQVTSVIGTSAFLDEFSQGGLWLYQLFPDEGFVQSDESSYRAFPELALLSVWQDTFKDRIMSRRLSCSITSTSTLLDEGLVAVHTVLVKGGKLKLGDSAPLLLPFVREYTRVGDLYDMASSRLFSSVHELSEGRGEVHALRRAVAAKVGLVWAAVDRHEPEVNVSAAAFQEKLALHRQSWSDEGSRGNGNAEQKGVEERIRGSALARRLDTKSSWENWGKDWDLQGVLDPNCQECVAVPPWGSLCVAVCLDLVRSSDGALPREKIESETGAYCLRYALKKHVRKLFDNIQESMRGVSTKATAAGSIEPRPKSDDGVVTLQDTISMYAKRERLSGQDTWYCSKCKDHRRAYKQLSIYKLPRVLVVHLKRFRYHGYVRKKIKDLVRFPLKGLDMSEFAVGESTSELLYDLFAVVNHFGSLSGGHYTAYAKSASEPNSWLHFDDSMVSKLENPEEVVSPSAYLLFYVLRS